MRALRPDTTAVAAKVIDGEAIIMNLKNGAYYSMDGVGAVIWEMIEQSRPAEVIHAAIIRRYKVEADTARRDVDRLLGELLAEGLVVATDAPAAPDEAAATGGGALPYTAPALNKYTEMADLLALDPPMPSISELPEGTSA